LNKQDYSKTQNYKMKSDKFFKSIKQNYIMRHIAYEQQSLGIYVAQLIKRKQLQLSIDDSTGKK